jgi:outer membrane immunogenic protein
MKKLLLLSVAVLALASGAGRAADMPLKAVPPVTGYDWSGIYVGGHIGGGWGTNEISDPNLGIVGILLGIPAVQKVNSSGFLGGAQAGWNYQIGRLVVGSEFDGSFSNITATNNASILGGLVNRALTAKTDWTATSTVRLGVASGAWLFYSKAGAALAHTSYNDAWSVPGFTFLTGNASQTRTGWTVGTGVEWGFRPNWSAKVEYDYIDLGSRTVPLNAAIVGAPITGLSIVNVQAINEVKAGINYRFMPLP